MTTTRKGRAVLDVECPVCAHIYSVSSAQVVAGTWRDCPKCGAPADAVPENDSADTPGGSEEMPHDH